MKTKMKQTALMRHFLRSAALLLLFGALSLSSFGQRSNVKDSLIEEKLVELALNGPAVKISEHQSKVNEYQLKRAKDTWLNLLTISGNYNEQTFAKNNNPVGYVYPKFFFGVTIPLGTILSRTDVKAAREGIEMGKWRQEELKRSIRAEIIGKYKQYKTQTELVNIQSELLNDVETELEESEEKFKAGKITIEAYNAAQKGRNDERARLINLKLQQDLYRLEIEKMIGVNLDTVMR